MGGQRTSTTRTPVGGRVHDTRPPPSDARKDTRLLDRDGKQMFSSRSTLRRMSWLAAAALSFLLLGAVGSAVAKTTTLRPLVVERTRAIYDVHRLKGLIIVRAQVRGRGGWHRVSTVALRRLSRHARFARITDRGRVQRVSLRRLRHERHAARRQRPARAARHARRVTVVSARHARRVTVVSAPGGDPGPSTSTGTDSGSASGSESAAPLKWAPPALTNPRTITLQRGNDYNYVWLDPRRDYIIKVPAGGIHSAVELDGGHNIIMIGGSITVPSTANQIDNGADNTDTGIYIRQATGIVHIEGVQITGDPNTQFDGIDVNAPAATVQLENIRVTNVWGSDTSMHADAVQTWGGVGALRIDRLSGDGDYQGLTLDPDLGPVGTVDLENVDLTYKARPPTLASMTVGGGYMIWLTKGVDTCSAPLRTRLKNVYVYNESHRVPTSNTVWPPSVGTALPCAGELSGTAATWNKLGVGGHVDLTAPPNGPFVPAGSAGDSYRSPGYVQAS